MSNPRSKAEQSKAKDLRQGVVEHTERSPKRHPRKLARPWKVMSTFPGLSAITGSDVFCAHRSPTKEDAETWVEKEARRGIMKAVDYWIEGPHERNFEK